MSAAETEPETEQESWTQRLQDAYDRRDSDSMFTTCQELLETCAHDEVVTTFVPFLEGTSRTDILGFKLPPELLRFFLGDTGVVHTLLRSGKFDAVENALDVLERLTDPYTLTTCLQEDTAAWSTMCRKQMHRGITWMLQHGVVPRVDEASGAALRTVRTWCLHRCQFLELLCADPRFDDDRDMHTLHHFQESFIGATAALSDPNNADVLAAVDKDEAIETLQEQYDKLLEFLTDVALRSVMPLGKRRR